MPTVAAFFTGGTISMTTDVSAGGNMPSLDAEALLARVPELATVADIVPVDRGRTPASHFTFPALFDLAAALRSAAEDPRIDGIVVVQGTDTLEETAFFFDLVVPSAKPIVVTGSMRSASEPGYDGPANLLDAVRVAADPVARGEGVLVVMASEIHGADAVAKTHTTSLTTFQSPDLGPLGHVIAGTTVLERRRVGRRHVEATRAAERVHLITATVAMDGSLIDAALGSGSDGLVVAATGSGNTSLPLLEAAARAMAAGVPVVLSTRCVGGRAGTAYASPGGGAAWVRAGAMLAGGLSAVKARVALAVGLGAGLDREALAALLADPSPGPA
ncbi:MAG TPA: asparaginase [Candidatus Dormibacteraeota bacterium]|nr:asparaginase [Candidatus Dormibacteraeota bacterium]